MTSLYNIIGANWYDRKTKNLNKCKEWYWPINGISKCVNIKWLKTKVMPFHLRTLHTVNNEIF